MAIRAPLISKVAAPGATLRMLAHTRPAQFPVFLDSAAEGPLTRHSILAFEPSAALLRDGHGSLTARGATQVRAGGFLDNLDAWLKSPKAFAPGTKMTFAGLGKAEDRANVILYLLQNGGGPPLPPPPAAEPVEAAAGDAAAGPATEPGADAAGAAAAPQPAASANAATAN